jgi:uncharacterized protein YutE (UPF0331/DUF86 family)
MDDVVINKFATIERCLSRIKEVYQQAGDDFLSDYTRQDSIILNLQRACEASIDLANYIPAPLEDADFSKMRKG